MKLRNKKTGEIVEREEFILIKHIDGDGGWQDGSYHSLAELNEEWEDYTSTEPLIKDKKIRKAVRAWADASGIEKVLSYGGTFWLGFRSINTESVFKFECNYADASDFEDKEFSIEELCGEEEE